MKLNHLFLLFFLLFGNMSYGQTDKIDQPIQNFEALWSAFNLRYANFDLKKVDWDKIYQQYRPKVTAQTNNKDLFEICCSMVQELNDGHVYIFPNFEDEKVYCKAPYEFSLRKAFPTPQAVLQFEQVMDKTLLSQGFSKPIPLRVTEDTNFQYRTSNDFGYLRIDGMTEVFPLWRLNKALNQSIKAFQPKKGIILDLRKNGGGWDKAAYRIASRLVNKKHVGYLKQERIKGTQNYTKLKTYYAKPKGKHQFTKPIIILTSDFTASAAEVFLLVMKDLPYVTIVGDTTEGIFSDIFDFELPNGWEASLSNQKFYDKAMNNYEGIGIVPDFQIINTSKDLETNIDPVIVKAMELLKKQ